MFNIIERYINKMTKEDIRSFAINKNINLSEQELDFTYDFVKKNYKSFFQNPKVFNINMLIIYNNFLHLLLNYY